MAKNVLKIEKNTEISPEFDKKTESKTSSTFDIKHKSLIQFVGTEKKITPFELRMVENYIIKAVFAKYKYDSKKFQIFQEGLMKHLKDISEKPENEIQKPLDLELILEEYIYKNLNFLKKEIVTNAIKKNGLLSFLMIIIQNKLEKENLLSNFMGKRIRHNQKIIYCSNERYGCNYKAKFADFLLHERDDCQFEKISCPFLNCKAKEFRKDMKTHERTCPFKVFNEEFIINKENPRTENKDLSILLHIDESKINFGENEKKNEDMNSSSESVDSPLIEWFYLLFLKIKNKFKLGTIQISDIKINKTSKAKFTDIKSNYKIIRLIHFMLLVIFFDSVVSGFFFMSLLLKIADDTKNIQGNNLTYLIAIAFILMIDILVILLAVFLAIFLYLQHYEGFGASLKILFCFSIIRIIMSILFFANFEIFKESRVCLDIQNLCQMNDYAEIDHYVSFGIQILVSICFFIIYCKF